MLLAAAQPLWVDLAIFTGALALILRGGDWFVDEAVWMAQATGVPRVIIGATIVSLATTLPEVTVSAIAAVGGHPGIAFGNVVGSTMANTGLILALLAVVRPVGDPSGGLRNRLGLMFLVAVAASLFAFDGRIARWEGLVLVGALAAHVWDSLRTGQRLRGAVAGDREQAASAEPSGSAARHVLRFVAGAALVALGSRFLVGSGSAIAQAAGVTETVIGITLVAVGTSLPELVTAVTSALKGVSEISMGNIVGANVLNLTLVMGGASAIHPIELAAGEARANLAAMLAILAMLIAFYATGRRLERWEGAVMLAGYGVFLWRVIGAG